MGRAEGALARPVSEGALARPVSEGALARAVSDGALALARRPTAAAGHRAGLSLAPPLRILSGPDKYRVLEHRRRQAQIKARHMLAASAEADAVGSTIASRGESV